MLGKFTYIIKVFFLILTITVTIILFCFSVSAAIVDTAFANIESSEIAISGNVKGLTSDLISIFFTKDNLSVYDTVDLTDDDGHIGMVKANEDGAYTYTFSFKGEEGTYNLYVGCGESIYQEGFRFFTKESIDDFIGSICNAGITDNEMIELLNTHQSVITVNLSFFNTEVKKNILLERIRNNRQEILEIKMEKLNEVIGVSKEEAELLENIKNASIWNVAYLLLTETTDITGIDFTEFNKLSEIKQKNIVSKLIGKSFNNAYELKEYFDDEVETQSNSKSNHDSGSGSGAPRSYGSSTTGIVSAPADISVLPEEQKFIDLNGVNWAKDSIDGLVKTGVICGVDDEHFQPDEAINREEFAKIIVLAFNKYNEAANAEFDDANINDWCYSYIASAKSEGLINGIDDNNFGVGKKLTRQDMALIIYRIAVLHGITFDLTKIDFADYDSISEYAKEAVGFLSGKGIINGTGNNMFDPYGYATRAQVAKLVWTMMEVCK